MKILHVINSLPLQGAQKLLRDVVVSSPNKADLSVFALAGAASRFESEIADEVELQIAPSSTPYSLKSFAHLLRFLKSRRFDVIHVHLFPAQLYMAFLAVLRASGAHLITTEHSTSNRRRHFSFFRVIDLWMYGRYERMICISEAARDRLRAWVPRLSDRCLTIPNGLRLTDYSMRPRRYRPPREQAPFRVLSMGRLIAEKDFATLIRAASLLGDGFHVEIYGEGPMRDSLNTLIAEHNLEDRVELRGLSHASAEALASADLYVQASQYEGFGIAALEAMACGVPVIVSDVPGLADMVCDAGLKFRPGDAEQLAKHVTALATAPALYESLSDRAIKRAAQFSIDEHIAAMMNVYRAVTTRLEGDPRA